MRRAGILATGWACALLIGEAAERYRNGNLLHAFLTSMVVAVLLITIAERSAEMRKEK